MVWQRARRSVGLKAREPQGLERLVLGVWVPGQSVAGRQSLALRALARRAEAARVVVSALALWGRAAQPVAVVRRVQVVWTAAPAATEKMRLEA